MHELALSDGRRARLRAIRPDDKGRLAAGLEALSPLSRYRRFLSPKPRLSSAELRYLTEVDGRDHVALVALAANAPECLVAVGRFVRLPEAPAAEALQRGVRRFRALTLEDNVPVQRLIARLARHLEYDRRSGGVRETVADLAA